MESIEFTMNYHALKMFGRQQYSNVWAALSELVANGFDAGAENVYLYIDMRNKKKSIIEIVDDGSGMDENDLRDKYAKIGRNRREEDPDDTSAGRKGIGKLAALYLSDKYQIISIKNGGITAWEVDVAGKKDNDTPQLDPMDLSCISISCNSIWNSETRTNGTAIRLVDVDLTRIGDRAIESLKRRLSNYFLLRTEKRTLHLSIVRNEADTIAFEKVEKEVAFDNMYCVFCDDSKLIDAKRPDLVVEYNTRAGKRLPLTVNKLILPFPEDVIDPKTKEKIRLSGERVFEGKTKYYEIKGWLGIHSSIETEPAQNNDARFVRNSYYNPNQIRIYVRNKLANDTFLSRLNLTGTFANYIEGEIIFDILDDNELADIATTNRQDFSIDDERVTLLRDILKGLCRQLINYRDELAKKIKEAQKAANDQEQSKQKTNFANETHRDLVSAGISPDKADELSFVISNKLSGNYRLKTTYKVFISHSSKDKIFTDFIVNYLRHRGFYWDVDSDKTEIFYSTGGTDITTKIPLAEIIRNMLVDSNTDILFFTSKHSMQSQYCLFEGGAAWATRAVADYSIISLDYSCIPEYLTNGKPEFTFNTRDINSFQLNRQNYINLITILNHLIGHLNKNRSFRGDPEVTLIPEPNFDDDVQMLIKGTSLEDYMDREICQYWKVYVLDHIEEYLHPEKADLLAVCL